MTLDEAHESINELRKVRNEQYDEIQRLKKELTHANSALFDAMIVKRALCSLIVSIESGEK